MYIPAPFKMEDPAKVSEVIESNSFATIISQEDNGMFASHLPILLRRGEAGYGTLVGHMARANPQWRHFLTKKQLLVIFQGPHAYISPSWYSSTRVVPTWNYIAVHVYGTPCLIEDEQSVSDLLKETVKKYEASYPSPWDWNSPPEYATHLIKAIVGFKISIDRVECKFKLGQNRDKEDLRGVHDALLKSGDSNSQGLAALMRAEVTF